MSVFKQFTATINDIIPNKRELVDVSCTERVGNVLDLLEQKNLTSVAIFGRPGAWIGAGSVELKTVDKQYIGIVSVADLLHFVLKGADAEERMHRSVVEAIGATNESRCLWVEPVSQYLYVAMEQFCKGTHYALTIDGSNHLAQPKMISQTDVVKYLIQNVMSMPILQQVFGESVLSITSVDVVTLSANASLGEGLNLLNVTRAVPVVDDMNNLISTISLSDFRGTFSTLVGALIPMSVHEFLIGQHHGMLQAPIVVTNVDSIGFAAQRMLDSHIHRVWVVDSRNPLELKGVVSLTDIIQVCFRNLAAHAPSARFKSATETHAV